MESSTGRRMVLTRTVELSILSGISYILMYLSFPILPMVPFMKIDFSDMPILIGTVVFGPVAGITIAALKSLLYWVVTGVSIPNLIGIVASFTSSVTLIYAYYGVNRFFHSKSKLMKGIVTIIAMALLITIVMSLLNWSFVLPMYMNLIGMKLGMSVTKMVLIGVVPFNIIKGIIVGSVFLLIKDKLLPAFRRRQ
ncbi:ECF transporter S component [Lentilactobacillus sp. Marseille-Q4993]|uniref:ECF transporter S component n=1 Tax=Lentilactobacillus sp. Marseille-Q4993 TaxID=3039492 RepID=UPI0024BD262B|nr:ECF transporter S component [Lentilactobacillus sp. Marseille-Q4993]